MHPKLYIFAWIRCNIVL